MLILKYLKSCLSSLIGVAVLAFCVKGEMGIPENEAALQFAHQWLANPKMYVGILVPNKRHFSAIDVVRLAKNINAGRKFRNLFLLIDSNVTKYNAIPHTCSLTRKEQIYFLRIVISVNYTV